MPNIQTQHYNFFTLALLMILGALIALSTSAYAAESASKADPKVKEALRELLKEDPDLVMDVLRQNSEAVLDIAQMGADLRRERALMAQWTNDLTIPKKVNLAGRATKGDAKAPVTIVAYTDFTCVFCGQAEQTLKKLYASYGGKIRIVYKSLPLAASPGSVEAAEFMLAAYMQEPAKSWLLFDEFFSHREEIIGRSGDTYLRSTTLDMGFNMPKLLADASGKTVKGILAEDLQEAKDMGVQGTPFFLINNIVVRGDIGEPLFRKAIDLALEDVQAKQDK